MDLRLVTISVPGSGMELSAPEEFFAFRALDEPGEARSSEHGALVRFGLVGRAASVFLSEDSGEVFSGMTVENLTLVNTSLARFVECTRKLSALFPLYSSDSDFEEWERGAQRVQEVVGEIDPAAYFEGAFWYEFRWDVSMGDFHG
ncbi:SUKH-4 family immunity protein [Streptomyces sp. NPDC004610]|uniref:SUKH-4 family immunity protein n=1 Tax=unclassified Streptomyces TaxID=2593676 RepID=UPI0033BDBB6C